MDGQDGERGGSDGADESGDESNEKVKRRNAAKAEVESESEDDKTNPLDCEGTKRRKRRRRSKRGQLSRTDPVVHPSSSAVASPTSERVSGSGIGSGSCGVSESEGGGGGRMVASPSFSTFFTHPASPAVVAIISNVDSRKGSRKGDFGLSNDADDDSGVTIRVAEWDDKRDVSKRSGKKEEGAKKEEMKKEEEGTKEGRKDHKKKGEDAIGNKIKAQKEGRREERVGGGKRTREVNNAKSKKTREFKASRKISSKANAKNCSDHRHQYRRDYSPLPSPFPPCSSSPSLHPPPRRHRLDLHRQDPRNSVMAIGAKLTTEIQSWREAVESATDMADLVPHLLSLACHLRRRGLLQVTVAKSVVRHLACLMSRSKPVIAKDVGEAAALLGACLDLDSVKKAWQMSD